MGKEQDKAYASRAQASAWTPDDAPSAFTDTVAASFALTRREELSDSAFRAFKGKNDKRAARIGELGGNPDLVHSYAFIDRPTAVRFRKAEAAGELEQDPLWQAYDRKAKDAYQHVREYERRFPDQVPDDVAMLEEFKAEAAQLRSAEQHTLERGGAGAAFLGGAGAVMTDPWILATMMLGGGVPRAGASILGVASRVGVREGAIGFGTEIPIQAAVGRFKQEIEAPWSFRDSAINVLAAGVGGAGLGFVIGGTVEGASRSLAKYREAKTAGQVAPTAELDAAESALEQTIALQRENPLDPEAGRAGEDVHQRAVETARAQLENGDPVDVADLVGELEVPDPIESIAARVEDPAQLLDLDPLELQVDAKTFQFKGGGDAEGVIDTLKGVERFDRRLAGVALIWERADGQRFIADGHQRLALARRALAGGQDPAEVRLNGFLLREADGISAVDARRMAAVKNMAEGSGSPIDAAKLLREVGEFGEAVLPPLPPRSALVRQAKGLAQLGDDEFMQVINGVVDARFGAMIGSATDDPALQQGMIRVFARTQPANENQARSIIDQVKAQGVETRTTEDLFGEAQISESLYLERAQVLDAALREASKDKVVFGRLVAEEGRITEGGANQLDRAANESRVTEAKNAASQISAIANSKGPLSDALTEAARRVSAGEKPARAAAAFLETARRAILESNSRGADAGAARPKGKAGSAPEALLEPAVGRPLRLQALTPAQQLEATRALVRAQEARSLDEVYEVAERHQAELAAVAEEIAAEMGEIVQFSNPGIKTKDRTAEKLGRGRYAKPGELTDIIRLGFMVETPEAVARIIARLGDAFELLDEGVTVTGMGYMDHKALVRFSDGAVGEIQIWEPRMAKAKFGPGHDLYQSAQALTDDAIAKNPALQAQKDAITEASKDLYAQALAAGNPEWRRVAMMMLPEDMRARVQAALETGGSEGAPGNISINSLRDIGRPESITSKDSARVQDDSPVTTTKASAPPAGVSRTTAGRQSQLKNRSAIDAAPRSVVRQDVDPSRGTPEATKTGVVPDIEYDAIMRRADELANERGELLQVASEAGELVETRSLRNVIDELDKSEETLERIRLCNLPERVIE